jgi:hypothetical protein
MRSLSRLATAALFVVLGATSLAAQQSAVTPLKFSGVVYADWQNGGTKAQRAMNKFDLTRAYLNFIMPAGDNITVRVTTDVLNNSASGYNGWYARMKYAFMEWAAWKDTGKDPASLHFRFGLEQTPEIDMMESFWQRGITNTPIDYLSFVPSSDLGAVVIYNLPGKMGQFYGGVFNGTGYGSAETDHFKNVNARFSWTPLANSTDAGYFKGLQISPYYQKGYTASTFDPTASAGLQHDLWGLHVGIKDPRLTIVGEYDSRTNGADTPTSPTVTTTTGAVYSGFVIARPLAFINNTKTNPWQLVLRADRYKPNTNNDAYQYFLIGGIGYDLSSKVSVYADYQDVEGHNFTSNNPDIKAFYFHFVMGF